MTITITEMQVYKGVIILFMLLQLYQWTVIKKLQNECSKLWEQVGTLVVGVSNQIIGLQKDLSKKEDKKAGYEANRDTK